MTATLSAARSFDSGPYFSAAQGLESQGRQVSQAVQDISNVRMSVADDWEGSRLLLSPQKLDRWRTPDSGCLRI